MKKIFCQNYEVYFKTWNALNAILAQGQYSSVAVLVDENTHLQCLPIFEKHVTVPYHIIKIDSGEQNKNIQVCSSIWNTMMEYDLDRKSLCINLGGGVIGDMGGFSASTFKRGMDFIQIPTTLLSMVDASIGGKLGIDFNGYKNTIGLFNDPNAVFIHPSFLKTLPQRELLSGMAEVYKHALIKSTDQWEILKTVDFSTVAWDELIYNSVIIKKEIVEIDPLEKGLRKILNFGHTLGHAFESSNLKREHSLLHGEAIILGMICEAFISHKKGMLEKEILEEITKTLLPKYQFLSDLNLNPSEIIAICKQDKKNVNGKILASLINNIGSCQFDIVISDDEIIASISYLKANLK